MKLSNIHDFVFQLPYLRDEQYTVANNLENIKKTSCLESFLLDPEARDESKAGHVHSL
jgi:hypothetical protein